MNPQTYRGIFGFGTSVLAVGITLTQVEQVLRVATAAVGLVIAILTLVSMLRQRRGRKPQERRE